MLTPLHQYKRVAEGDGNELPQGCCLSYIVLDAGGMFSFIVKSLCFRLTYYRAPGEEQESPKEAPKGKGGKKGQGRARREKKTERVARWVFQGVL